MDELVPFGQSISDEEALRLPTMTKALVVACASSGSFELVEHKSWESKETGLCDVLVVECCNDQVPTRNTVGLNVREYLALVLPRDPSVPPQVRALRKTFPTVMHLNQVSPGEPASLCLYFEPWSSVRRSWTPQRFLQRILFWLTETSKGTLHRPDQPVEAMYLESPLHVVLPPSAAYQLDSRTTVLQPDRLDIRSGDRVTTRVRAIPAIEAKNSVPQCIIVRVKTEPIIHAGVEAFPGTLGELVDQFTLRGISLLSLLNDEVRTLTAGQGTDFVAEQTCLLLLTIPMRRTKDGDVQRVIVRGFLVRCSLRQFGTAIGALDSGRDGLSYAVPLIGFAERHVGNEWRNLLILPIDVKEEPTRAFARVASGVQEGGANESRILAGVGALGSQLADLWSRCGWGRWTFVDPDVVEPHNLARHIAKNRHLGVYKAAAVKHAIDEEFPFEHRDMVAIAGSVLTTTNEHLVERLAGSVLLVDASTTLEVPRELSQRESLPRCASVFVTPSGRASVMLMEAADRSIRLDELEAQYYAAILASEWGHEHLIGHNGDLWVGGGCRDVSLVISNESILLHVSILSRQMRLLSERSSACVHLWIAEEATGGVNPIAIPVQTTVRETRGEWTIVSYQGVADEMKRLRASRSPAETGGIIVGYVDHPTKKIFVVQVLPAPADSRGTRSEFVRGVKGLQEEVACIRRRTAHIVGYIGEWHSHPPMHSPTPSSDDMNLLSHCARVMARDGDPAVMMIVGSGGEISYSLRSAEG